MKQLQKVICTLNALSSRPAAVAIDSRVQLLIALLYILVVLTVPLTEPVSLLWLFVYPIIMSEAIGVGYLTLFRQSLWVLPLLIVIGGFNPLFDRAPWWIIKGVEISRGWISFTSIMLRGLLTFQALLMLTRSIGFTQICRAMQSMHVPQVLVTQLMMLYRYVGVLVDEALTMEMARQSRGYGRKSYPLKLWASFVGQLLMRSVKRAQRIHACMLARGFNGNFFIDNRLPELHINDYLYFAVWLAAFVVLRFVDLSSVFTNLLKL